MGATSTSNYSDIFRVDCQVRFSPLVALLRVTLATELSKKVNWRVELISSRSVSVTLGSIFCGAGRVTRVTGKEK